MTFVTFYIKYFKFFVKVDSSWRTTGGIAGYFLTRFKSRHFNRQKQASFEWAFRECINFHFNRGL